MFVFNNCANDARVLKEAKTLTEAGHIVEIVALLDKKTVPDEEKEGFSIHRLALNPVHLQLIRFFGNPLKFALAYLKGSNSETEITAPKKRGRGLFGSVVMRMRIWNRKLRKKIIANRQAQFEHPSLMHADNRKLVLSAVFSSPAILSQVLFFAVAYLVFRSYRLGRWVVIKSYRYIKIGIQRSAKFLIQKPLKWLLLPWHKYFTYHDFYRKAMSWSTLHPADVYHCHDLNTLKIGIELKRRQKALLVYDSHELYLHKNRIFKPGRIKQMILERIERKGMNLADTVITVGACIAEWMAEKYKVTTPTVILNAPKFKEANEGVKDGVSLRSALNIPQEKFLLIYSGGITFNRGLENVIKAVSQIDDIFFVMLGYGNDDYLASLRKLIIDEEAQDKISFYGPVPHAEVASYLASADCGIAPIMNICLSYYFCAPNKLFEFVQARLPVLASNFPEMQKVIDDNDIGLTFDPANVQSIIDSIMSMKTNDEKREYYRGNTHSAAMNYNWRVEEEKLKAIYNRLIEAA
ncbi:MAG: glycosyltransferase [Flavobacteriales bacterium]|jgi:glycosyltransferase involved in cell wall biosynthesis|nr:glycosyltransferase [Flavobacteriales bacterium]MBT4704222.1 glycosyltransferase [Flavobacteriales bacterium]MBT4929956.1 glycosyltransferase [Flavobacteriales bacterium]MBT6382552.1 glycosyltransferase [Flavobacteriales bacterium]MBT6916177.1 glycosyltransferase [Flavobacteriales bacterium]